DDYGREPEAGALRRGLFLVQIRFFDDFLGSLQVLALTEITGLDLLGQHLHHSLPISLVDERKIFFLDRTIELVRIGENIAHQGTAGWSLEKGFTPVSFAFAEVRLILGE